MESPKKEIKKQEGVIDVALSDKYMQEIDATPVKDATDALQKIKDDPKQNTERKETAKKTLEKYKTPIKDSIINHLSTKNIPTANWNIKIDNISKLIDIKQIEAYKNIITRINEPDNESLKKISLDLTAKSTAIATNETKEKTDTATKKLQDILDVTNPSLSQADKLFWGSEENKDARNALFDVKNISITISTTVESKNPNDMKLQKLIAIYAGAKNEDITKIEMKGPSTEYKENYIKVTTDKWTKDILFTKTTDENYQKRSETFDATTFTKSATISKDIENLDTKWSYRSFEKLIKDGNKINLKTLLTTEPCTVFKDIQTFNGDTKVDDHTTKENGYYNVITDYVVSKTKENPWDLTLLQAYLKNVNAQSITYLGTDSKAQISNYNKLVDLVDPEKNPNFPRTTEVGKEILKNIKALQTQLQNVKWRKEALNSWVEWFFKAYGKQLTSVLEFFGGKGCVKKFFSSMGMDAFYEKNLKTIDDNINKIYKEKFDLSKNQKDGIDATILTDKKANFDETIIDTKTTTIGDAIDGFKGKANTIDKDKSNQIVITEKLKTNIWLLDPNLVHYLANKTFDKKDGIWATDDGKPLTLNDFVVKDGATNERKINENLTKNPDNQEKLIARLFADKATRNSIKWSNARIEGLVTSKPDAKEIEYSRSDLWKTGEKWRKEYSIQSDQDIARFFTAYAFAGSKSLDYVITESEQSHNRTPPVAPVEEVKTTEKQKQQQINQK